MGGSWWIESPEDYIIGNGEYGVLLYEPYKSQLLPHWKFRTPEEACKSANTILQMFYQYLDRDDFPGADMAKKYLRMGFTRSQRYAKYPGGVKKGNTPQIWYDPEKRQSACIFKKAFDEANSNKKLKYLRKKHTTENISDKQGKWNTNIYSTN
jgi:hypothetical protein